MYICRNLLKNIKHKTSILTYQSFIYLPNQYTNAFRQYTFINKYITAEVYDWVVEKIMMIYLHVCPTDSAVRAVRSTNMLYILSI